MRNTDSSIILSIVIPVFNEEENLKDLIREMRGVLENLNVTYEIICVNDGSIDNSMEILETLSHEYLGLVIKKHNMNLGESAAEATGFLSARGEIIVTIDADLQNDPRDIPKLINVISCGADCASGVRKFRRDNIIRKLSSWVANRSRNFITGDNSSDTGCTFRAIRKEALNELFVFNGMHRFLPTILKAQGYNVCEIVVSHRMRNKGKSKYTIRNRMWRGLVDCFAIRWYRTRAIRRKQ
jgi:dolichol-phosphate mannosyltransferase